MYDLMLSWLTVCNEVSLSEHPCEYGISIQSFRGSASIISSSAWTNVMGVMATCCTYAHEVHSWHTKIYVEIIYLQALKFEMVEKSVSCSPAIHYADHRSRKLYFCWQFLTLRDSGPRVLKL
jgi:hypothetical protein